MQYSFNHNDLKWHSLPTSSHRMKNIGIQGFSLPPFPILTLIKHSLSWHLPNYGNYLPYLNFFFFWVSHLPYLITSTFSFYWLKTSNWFRISLSILEITSRRQSKMDMFHYFHLQLEIRFQWLIFSFIVPCFFVSKRTSVSAVYTC